MSISTVKSSLKSSNNSLMDLSRNIMYLLNEINHLTIENALAVVEPCNRLLYSIENSEREITKLHGMTSVELHIFFRDINNKMLVFNSGNSGIKSIIQSILSLAHLLWELHLINIAMEGLLEFTMDISEIQIFSNQIYSYYFDVNKLIIDLQVNDKKLILPSRR